LRRSFPRRSELPVLALLAGALVYAPSLAAQDARVVACNSSNGQILEIDFEAGTSTLLTNDGGRTSMQSCEFRSDGAGGLHLLVADRKGELVFFENTSGVGRIVLGISAANPAHPDGLSQDAQQNLYGVTSSTGAAADSVAKVWMLRRASAGPLPGGYAGPVGYIDSSIPGIQLLSETIFVTSNLGSLVAGDLLVLASAPATVLRYRSAELAAFRAQLAAGVVPTELVPEVFLHPPGAAVPAARRFPAGATPNGMDLTQDGKLLISTGEGTVLLFDADGTRRTNSLGQFVDFVTGLGNGSFKLATGLQDGALRVFLAERNGGVVHRFGLAADGTGILESSVTDPESPNGIATTTAAVQLTPAGSGIVVRSSDLIVSTIENVPHAGATSITEFVFTDPRESEPGAPTNPSAPLHRALDLNLEISSLLPAGVTIPAHVRAFRKADPVTGLPTGAPTFVLLVAGTSAEILGTIQHITDDQDVLGYKPSCTDANLTLRPRLFWRDNPAAGESPTPEGDFINVSNGCGSSRGLTKGYSLFLPARDTRSTAQIFSAQLNGLGLSLSQAQCVRARTLRAMQRQYDIAKREFERGRLDKALLALQSLLAIVEGAPQDFAGCGENESGDIRARIGAAIFTLSG
jgi:hypothetical protein